MNVTVLQAQIVFWQCPYAQACRLRPPLDDLAERLRREMQYGRDCNRGPTDPSVETKDTMFGFHNSFQYN